MLFVYIKPFTEKNCSLYINVNNNDSHQRNATCTSEYIQKAKKARQFPLRFYIHKFMHFMLRGFHEIFEIGIYIQKAWHFALHDVFIWKNPETLQKSKTNFVTFLYTKIRTLCVTRFLIEFFKLAEGGENIFIIKK